MGEYQTIGLQADLKTKAESSPSAMKKSGEYQTTGLQAPLNHAIIPSPSAVQTKGEYQVIGDQVALSQTPVKSIGNNTKLPFSEMALKQSQVGTANAKVTRK